MSGKHARRHLEQHLEKGLKLPEKKQAVSGGKVLEVVLKCDSYGSVEAVVPELDKIWKSGVAVKVIHADVGDVSKSDLLLAMSASRLILGFNVGVMPRLEQDVRDSGAEVRLYNVIYDMMEDIGALVSTWVPPVEAPEKILGKGKVIALFKSGRGGVILGCEIQEGVMAVGQNFRVIAAMGPVYTGRIESLQVEHKAVRQATRGLQVGLKVPDFKDVHVGDLVETFEKDRSREVHPWAPSGNVVQHFLG